MLYMRCINEMGDISGDIYNVMRFRAVSRPKYNVPCSTRHHNSRSNIISSRDNKAKKKHRFCVLLSKSTMSIRNFSITS